MDIFKSEFKHQSVNSFLNDLETTGRIELDPLYQRDNVWTAEQRSLYINSVIKGIANNNFTFNHLTKKTPEGGKRQNIPRDICIDGKQRCTSLSLFRKNETYVMLDDDDETKYYYGPKRKDIPSDGKVLPEDYRIRFQDDMLNFVTYQDLTYEEEMMIFNRIQHGKQMTAGELVLSQMNSAASCAKLKTFCEHWKDHLKHYCVAERKCNYYFVTKLLYLLDTDLTTGLTNVNINKFLKQLQMSKMIDLLKRLETSFGRLFTKTLLNSPKVLSTNMSINEVLIYCYFFCKNFATFSSVDDDDHVKKLIEAHSHITDKKSTKSNLLQMFSTFSGEYENSDTDQDTE